MVAGRRVPLESDLTTPLAYFLSNPEMNLDTATEGLLEPGRSAEKACRALLKKQPSRPIEGLYMVQPYEPGKIPVLMVHGLWSSPMTWMEMFNDLRSQPEIRDHYQFWFYLYPTGQPFWLSAAQLRHDLAKVRDMLDPSHEEPALDQMVLIGHSMGGLVSRLQTLPSGDDLLATGEPRAALANQSRRRRCGENCRRRSTFSPTRRSAAWSPSPRRTAAATFSNQTTQWLLDKLIHLPNTARCPRSCSWTIGAFPEHLALGHPHEHRLAGARRRRSSR